MDFSRLPDNVFLQIFDYLPIENCTRLGCVNKSFHRMSQSTISRTKFLDLADDRFRKLRADQLTVILDLCSSNLEKINFPIYYQTSIPSSLLAPQFASTLANYECPRLTHITLWNTPIDYAVFEQLIRNNSNLESFRSHATIVGFPDVISNNLKILYLRHINDVNIQSMTGRIPNLKELDFLDINVTANDVLDEFFASTPQIQRASLYFVTNQIVFNDSLVNFWNLPLTSLTINLNGGIVLQKVATSFPHLQTLLMGVSNPSTHGISALAALQELKILQLDIPNNATDHNNDHEIRALVACKQLQRLRLPQSIVTPGTVIALLRGCPQLDTVHIYDIDQVATPDEAAVVLESLSRIAKRDILIIFDRDDAEMEEWFQSIWESEAVEEAIKKLVQNEGFRIRIDWMYRPEGGGNDGEIGDE